jgi:hypothetical protein
VFNIAEMEVLQNVARMLNGASTRRNAQKLAEALDACGVWGLHISPRPTNTKIHVCDICGGEQVGPNPVWCHRTGCATPRRGNGLMRPKAMD